MDIEEPNFSKFATAGTRSKDDPTRNKVEVGVKERDEDIEGSFTWMDSIVKYLKNGELPLEKTEAKRL